MKKPNRSRNVILTAESRILKKLRLKHGYSMRAAGDLLGYSDSYISHIENGRADVPTGATLLKFLKIYGDIKPKYFYELVRDWKHEVTDVEITSALLGKLKPDQLRVVRAMVEQMTSGQLP